MQWVKVKGFVHKNEPKKQQRRQHKMERAHKKALIFDCMNRKKCKEIRWPKYLPGIASLRDDITSCHYGATGSCVLLDQIKLPVPLVTPLSFLMCWWAGLTSSYTKRTTVARTAAVLGKHHFAITSDDSSCCVLLWGNNRLLLSDMVLLSPWWAPITTASTRTTLHSVTYSQRLMVTEPWKRRPNTPWAMGICLWARSKINLENDCIFDRALWVHPDIHVSFSQWLGLFFIFFYQSIDFQIWLRLHMVQNSPANRRLSLL